MGIWSIVDALAGWRWKTIAGHRCLISLGGRIIKGPREWEGVHVSRLHEFLPHWRELHDGAPCDAPKVARAETFTSKQIPAHAILEINNPELWERIHEDGAVGSAYSKWLKDRKGKKPKIPVSDGRFDLLNEVQERKGSRRICCWLEAIYACLPSSRRWAEIDLSTLEEIHGKPLLLPEAAEISKIEQMTTAECEARYDARLAALVDTHADPLDPAPF